MQIARCVLKHPVNSSKFLTHPVFSPSFQLLVSLYNRNNQTLECSVGYFPWGSWSHQTSLFVRKLFISVPQQPKALLHLSNCEWGFLEESLSLLPFQNKRPDSFQPDLWLLLCPPAIVAVWLTCFNYAGKVWITSVLNRCCVCAFQKPKQNKPCRTLSFFLAHFRTRWQSVIPSLPSFSPRGKEGFSVKDVLFTGDISISTSMNPPGFLPGGMGQNDQSML